MNCIFSLCHLISVQGREPYLDTIHGGGGGGGAVMKGCILDTRKPTFFQLDMRIDTASVTFMPVLITLIFIQVHCLQESKIFFVHSLIIFLLVWMKVNLLWKYACLLQCL